MSNRSLCVYVAKTNQVDFKSNFSINNTYLYVYVCCKLCNFIGEINLWENAKRLFPNVKKIV